MNFVSYLYLILLNTKKSLGLFFKSLDPKHPLVVVVEFPAAVRLPVAAAMPGAVFRRECFEIFTASSTSLNFITNSGGARMFIGVRRSR